MSGSRIRDLLHISGPFTKRACFISVCVIIVLSVRLWLMGGSMPLFSEQDNPASFSPYLLTRILTYSYLLSFNAWLLLVPAVLCYDWQVGSIPLVESLGDSRNGATVLLALVIVTLCIRCIFSLQVVPPTCPCHEQSWHVDSEPRGLLSSMLDRYQACYIRGTAYLDLQLFFVLFDMLVHIQYRVESQRYNMRWKQRYY